MEPGKQNKISLGWGGLLFSKKFRDLVGLRIKYTVSGREQFKVYRYFMQRCTKVIMNKNYHKTTKTNINYKNTSNTRC